MDKTKNYNLNLPDEPDIADIGKISENFTIIDEELNKTRSYVTNEMEDHREILDRIDANVSSNKNILNTVDTGTSSILNTVNSSTYGNSAINKKLDTVSTNLNTLNTIANSICGNYIEFLIKAIMSGTLYYIRANSSVEVEVGFSKNTMIIDNSECVVDSKTTYPPDNLESTVIGDHWCSIQYKKEGQFAPVRVWNKKFNVRIEQYGPNPGLGTKESYIPFPIHIKNSTSQTISTNKFIAFITDNPAGVVLKTTSDSSSTIELRRVTSLYWGDWVRYSSATTSVYYISNASWGYSLVRSL